jgi:ABC-2 type transport system ATP-binding protein
MSAEVGIAIRCEGLSKTFGDVQALKDLNLSVPEGSIFGFLGRNGAGKTTTIRLLTGLAHPSAGSAWIAGVETTNGDSIAREKFGYLPQDPAFYNWMTPVEYLDYVLSLFSVPYPDRKKQIEQVLARVDLLKASKRRIGGFSGGMKQRLGIAQALVHNPPVLMLDEPTSSLDPAGRYELLDLMENLRGEATIFFSTHILSDVERICDRIGVIHEGVLLFETGRQELMQRYETNAVVLEFDSVSLPIPGAFITKLRSEPWVNTLQDEKTSLRLSVSDIEEAKKTILKLVVENDLRLNRYEWVRPSLEEIFLQVSK